MLAALPWIYMDTIAKHRRSLLAQYVLSPSAADIIGSAKHIAQIVLASNLMLQKHRNKVLTEVLWLISEAGGKYSTRYRSAEVVRLATQEPNSLVKIQHEHVFPRKRVIEEILQRRSELLEVPAELDRILESTVGCVVTELQHKQLGKHHHGWARYREIEVLDMSTVPPSPHNVA